MGSNGQRLPTAMELSLHKANRDRQVQQALMEQRQISAGYSLNGQPANVSDLKLYFYLLIIFFCLYLDLGWMV